METKIKIGWYAFEGGQFSSDPEAYPNLQGVVAWLNPNPDAPIGERGLILMPEATRDIWAEDAYKTGFGDENDGKANTQKIIAFASEHNVKYPAATWCHSYSNIGVKSGEGFLPAKNQLQAMIDKCEIINMALKRIGGVRLDGWIWSSSEYNDHFVWGINANHGTVDGLTKYSYYGYYVRCVIAF